jgi:hypothetical protein
MKRDTAPVHDRCSTSRLPVTTQTKDLGSQSLVCLPPNINFIVVPKHYFCSSLNMMGDHWLSTVHCNLCRQKRLLFSRFTWETVIVFFETTASVPFFFQSSLYCPTWQSTSRSSIRYVSHILQSLSSLYSTFRKRHRSSRTVVFLFLPLWCKFSALALSRTRFRNFLMDLACIPIISWILQYE